MSDGSVKVRKKKKRPGLVVSPTTVLSSLDAPPAASSKFMAEQEAIAAVVHRFKQKDPAAFGLAVHEFEQGIAYLTKYRLAVGLDLGTSCGVSLCWFQPGVSFRLQAAYTVMSQLDLSAGPYDAGAIRIVRLRQFLSAINPHIVFYEDVRFTPAEAPNRFNANAIIARAATPMEWFGALKGCVGGWAEEHGIPCQGFPIGTIKKRATGMGNAGKPAVITGVNEIFGVDLNPEGYESSGDDNIADAATCLLLGLEQYAAGMK